jgi:hypothetical protein
MLREQRDLDVVAHGQVRKDAADLKAAHEAHACDVGCSKARDLLTSEFDAAGAWPQKTG